MGFLPKSRELTDSRTGRARLLRGHRGVPAGLFISGCNPLKIIPVALARPPALMRNSNEINRNGKLDGKDNGNQVSEYMLSEIADRKKKIMEREQARKLRILNSHVPLMSDKFRVN